MENQRPKVGVGVMILNNKSEVLLGKRKSVHGLGEYGWPGGHLEYGESFEACAKRETMEETGVEIVNVRFLRLMNFKKGEKHYADVGLIADFSNGEPKTMEPDKCDGWAWYNIDKLPQPLFGPVATYIEAYKTGKNYFDIIK